MDSAHLAERLGDALGAPLASCSGPDALARRVEAGARLEQDLSRIADTEVHLAARLWRLATGLETLDLGLARRSLAAMELLAVETDDDRMRFFASSRRAMFALAEADPVGAGSLLDEAEQAGTRAGVPGCGDVVHTLRGELARQQRDVVVLAEEAATLEERGARHGLTPLLATASVLRLESGDPDAAGRRVDEIWPRVADLPRDDDWVLVLAKVCEAAAGSERPDVARGCARMLGPYAGRGVVQSWGAAFAGVVDDYLALGTGDRSHATRARALYERIGADWWVRRSHLVPAGPPPPDGP